MTPTVSIKQVDNNTLPLFHQIQPGSYFLRESRLWANIIYKKYQMVVHHTAQNAIIVSHPDPNMIGLHENVPCDTEVLLIKSLSFDVKYSV